MCRKKKIKCDGKLPACTHCLNYKTDCVFTQVEKKRSPPKGYVPPLSGEAQALNLAEAYVLSPSFYNPFTDNRVALNISRVLRTVWAAWKAF